MKSERYPIVRLRAECGASAVELAFLLLFILIPLFVGVLDAGQLLHAQYVITRAASEGAAQAAKGNAPQSTISTYLSNSGLNSNLSTVSVTSGYASLPAGTEISVSVSYRTSGLTIINWGSLTGLTSLSTLGATSYAYKR